MASVSTFDLFFQGPIGPAFKNFCAFSENVLADANKREQRSLLNKEAVRSFLNDYRGNSEGNPWTAYHFPYRQNNYEKASPFKKIAYFFISLHEKNPFHRPTASFKTSEGFCCNYERAVATYVGFKFAQFFLHGVTLTRKNADPVTLTNPIVISSHFYQDWAFYSREGLLYSKQNVKNSHFGYVALLFEMLTYKVNPDAMYPPGGKYSADGEAALGK